LHFGVFSAGFLVLGGMMIYAYFKIEERNSSLSTAVTRVETKLDDLIARVPPVQSPIPRKP
jgi:CHASE3 domain sensor protein